MMEHHYLSRRSVVACLMATAGLTMVGCGQARTPDKSAKAASQVDAPAITSATAMTVYRDPSCGCCEAWAEIARNAAFQVEVIDHPNMASIKQQYGVPQELLSCHTTIVGGYAVEGHVPIADVTRLLKEKPNIRGIGVPGMPFGSPGMEVPDGTVQPFEVLAFDADGRVSFFRT